MKSPRPERIAGLLLVLALHGGLLHALWSHRLLPSPADAMTVFVDLIDPPKPPQQKEEPKPEPVKLKKRPAEVPPPRVPPPTQLAVETPAASPTETVAPPAPPAPPGPAASIETGPAAPAPRPAGPVSLGSELSVSCPERLAPVYPAAARRLGEQGRVVLRVELDERGLVTAVEVSRSSGSTRLDESAASAVRQWRCNPARREGVPVRAVALQPFDFILEGR